MTDPERIGVRAFAWSEADRAAILKHFIDLMTALEVAVEMLKDTAYYVRQRPKIDRMREVLAAPPPVRRPQ